MSESKETVAAGGKARGAVSRGWWAAIWRRVWLWPLFYLALVLVMMGFEERLVFIPSRYPSGNWQPVGPRFEEAHFTADDGVALHGWYMPHDNPRAFAVLSHGNAGNVTHRYQVLQNLHALGVATLVYDYRGYGRSQATFPNEAGVLRDGAAATQWLARKAAVSETAIVHVGESLGGGVAVQLAADRGARGLVLINTFSSLPDVAAWRYPFLPVRWIMRSRLDSAGTIGRYTGPVLQTHGDSDSVIPLYSAEKLHAAANAPKEFVLIPQGDHNDPLASQFLRALDRFLDTLPVPGASP